MKARFIRELDSFSMKPLNKYTIKGENLDFLLKNSRAKIIGKVTPNGSVELKDEICYEIIEVVVDKLEDIEYSCIIGGKEYSYQACEIQSGYVTYYKPI